VTRLPPLQRSRVSENEHGRISDGLVALVRETLGEDPFSGTIFIFRAKRADRVKIIAWDGSGLALFWKRLEHGAFKWPPVSDGVMRLAGSRTATC
jgi:transposase